MIKIKRTILNCCMLSLLTFNAQAKEIDNVYSKFLIEHKESTFKFFSRGTSSFEYICKKPSNSIDCRKDKIGYLKDKNDEYFNITKLIKLEEESLYEIYLDKEYYYLNAKRVINGLNSTHYFLDESLYRDNHLEQEKVYLLSIMNKDFVLEPEKIKKSKLILCKDRIVLNSCTNIKKEYVLKNKNVKVIDAHQKDSRHLIRVKLEKTNKEYWIEYYIFKILIQK